MPSAAKQSEHAEARRPDRGLRDFRPLEFLAVRRSCSGVNGDGG